MSTFPRDASKRDVLPALYRLGFVLVRERQHISLISENADGTRTPLTMPNHPKLKASTLRAICQQAGIPRDDFLAAFRGD